MNVSGNAIDFTDAYEENARDELNTGALSMETFWVLRNCWSTKTFGSVASRGPLGPLDHLAKEIPECRDAINTLASLRATGRTDKYVGDDTHAAVMALREEIADLLFLVFDIAHRSGMNWTDLRRAVTSKLVKNRARKWGAASATSAVEHIRDGE